MRSASRASLSMWGFSVSMTLPKIDYIVFVVYKIFSLHLNMHQIRTLRAVDGGEKVEGRRRRRRRRRESGEEEEEERK